MLILREFLSIFDVLVNEFRIINDHFEASVRSTTDDYDLVFYRWGHDIQRRFRHVTMMHRWATNQRLVLQNVLFFVVRYGMAYNCEVKYLFSQKFRGEFPEMLKTALDTLNEVLFRFQLFVLTFRARYDVADHLAFEQEFLEWKRTLYKKAEVYAVDFFWVDKASCEDSAEVSNELELSLSQRDNFVILVRFDLDNPPPLIKEFQMEQDIS